MANEHDYFDFLVAHGDHHASESLRTQAGINAISSSSPNNTFTYDATADACHCPTEPNGANPSNNPQLEWSDLTYPAVNNVLITWDAKWPTAMNAESDAWLNTHKCFQGRLIDIADSRRVETQIAYSTAVSPQIALAVSNRYYHWETSEGDDPPADIQFPIEGDKWTRFWDYIDFDNDVIEKWVSDEDRDPVLAQADDITLWDNQPSGTKTRTINAFELEFNTSQVEGDAPRSDNTSAAKEGVSFLGTVVSGTFADLYDSSGATGPEHILEEDGGAAGEIDIVYEYDMTLGTANGVPFIRADGVRFRRTWEDGGNSLTLQAWDHVGSGWDTLATISGESGEQQTWHALDDSKHHGTGGNAGRVLLRITVTGATSPHLEIDVLNVGTHLSPIAWVRNIAVLSNVDKAALIAAGARPLAPVSPVLTGPKGRSARRRGGRGRTRI